MDVSHDEENDEESFAHERGDTDRFEPCVRLCRQPGQTNGATGRISDEGASCDEEA
jgi:hypothetical protein